MDDLAISMVIFHGKLLKYQRVVLLKIAKPSLFFFLNGSGLWRSCYLAIEPTYTGHSTMRNIRDFATKKDMFQKKNPGDVMEQSMDFLLWSCQEGQGASRIGGTPEFMAPEVWSGTYGALATLWRYGCK
jgi:hypothetical protein